MMMMMMMMFKYYFVHSSNGLQSDCPAGQLTLESCTWMKDAERDRDSFLPGHRYLMQVTLTNKYRPHIQAKSQLFKIDTTNIGQY